jgi:hypothetical protein
MGIAKVSLSQWANTGSQDFIRIEGKLCPKHILSTLQARHSVSNLKAHSLERCAHGNSDCVKASWLAARPGREVLEVASLTAHGKEVWEIVLVEDDKGLIAVRADSRELALKRAMAAIKNGNVPR